MPADSARNMRDRAVELARQGFKVFPLKAGTKDQPLVPWGTVPKGEYFDRVPSDNDNTVYSYWTDRRGEPLNHNIGISTNDLLVVDLDVKNGKNGIKVFIELQKELGLPTTVEAVTPSGGRHVFYRLPNGDKASCTTSKLGDGIDTRGWHGYVVAPGSILPSGEYNWAPNYHPKHWPMAPAPEALLARCLASQATKKQEVVAGLELDSPHALKRATDWLLDGAPEAIENAGGDFTTFKVACTVIDMGISEAACLDLMEAWNEVKAHPPWAIEELEQKIANAWAYRKTPVGSSSAEADFDAVPIVEIGEKVGATEPKLPPLTLSWWAGRDLPEPEFICGQWLTTTSRVILNAPTGLGKSVFAVGLGMAIAAQKDFLHWKAAAKPFRVLYIDGEMSNRLLKQRLADEVKRIGFAPETFYALSHEDLALAPLNTPQGQKLIDYTIEKLGGVDLIEFDNVMSLIPGDQKEEEGWARVLPWVRSLTKRGIGQVWIHHTGLNKTHGYGTSTREWQLDTVMHLTEVKRPDTDISFEIKFPKARERTPAKRSDFATRTVALLHDKWSTGATVDFEPQLTNEQQEWVDLLKAHTAMFGLDEFTCEDMLAAWAQPKRDLADMSANLSLRTVRRHADTLENSGHIKLVSEKEARPKVYKLADISGHGADTPRINQ